MTSFERLYRTTEEQESPVDATVSGEIPDWLEGVLLKVGPGVFDLDSGFTVNHLFDGYSVIQKFAITGGKVGFSKRYLKSDAYIKAQKNGKPSYFEFGTKAYNDSSNVISKLFSTVLPDTTDNCHANIIKIGKSYFVMTVSALLRVIDPDNLSTGEKVDLHSTLGVRLYPRLSPCTVKDSEGNSYLLCSGRPNGSEYHIIKVPDSNNTSIKAFKNAKRISTISSKSSVLIASFGMSEKYFVVIEPPLILKRSEMIGFVKNGGCMRDLLAWKSDLMNRFWVIEKETGKVLPTVYESEQPFFFFHHINSYEDNNEIIVDLIGYDGADVLMEHLYLNNLRKGTRDPPQLPQARRFILPILNNIEDANEGVNLVKRGSACRAIRKNDKIVLSYQVICSSAHEIPSINMRYFGVNYRYYYASGTLFTGEYGFCVVKVDLKTGIVQKWFAGDGNVPSDVTFITRPNSTKEDDGVLLVNISASQPGGTDQLVILEASNLHLIASASVPCHVPMSRRAIFVHKDNL